MKTLQLYWISLGRCSIVCHAPLFILYLSFLPGVHDASPLLFREAEYSQNHPAGMLVGYEIIRPLKETKLTVVDEYHKTQCFLSLTRPMILNPTSVPPSRYWSSQSEERLNFLTVYQMLNSKIK